MIGVRASITHLLGQWTQTISVPGAILINGSMQI
jgi:hypothetical protein